MNLSVPRCPLLLSEDDNSAGRVTWLRGVTIRSDTCSPQHGARRDPVRVSCEYKASVSLGENHSAFRLLSNLSPPRHVC